MYKFVDTTETSGGIWLSSEAVSLDGKLIEDYVDGYHTLAVSGRESLEFEIDDEDRPTGVNGMNYYGKRMKGRELEVTFQLVASSAEELMARFRKLVNFVKGENRQIRFANEPAAHYTGTIETLDAPDAGMLQVTSKMKFYCPDPALESDVTTTVAITADDSGILRKTFNYDGSATAYPTYRITHNSDNGYIGIAATTGSFEMGNIEEIDGETYSQFETLVSDGQAPSKFVQVDSCPMDSAFGCSRSPKISSKGELGIANADKASSGIDGVCYRYTAEADSNGEIGGVNFYVNCRLRFTCGRDTSGIASVAMADEDNQIIAAYQCVKWNTTSTTARYEMKIGPDSAANSGIWQSFDFDCRDSGNNPFCGSRGYCDLWKRGDQLRFYFDRKYYYLTNSAIADKKIKYIYIYLGKLVGGSNWPYNLSACLDGQIGIGKDNVQKWKDIPNRYRKDSVILINSESDQITLNGLPANNELVVGSEFPILKPGSNTIEVYPSSWCTKKPTVNVEFRKRWL